jgi:predicted nucleic acid-binding protein
MEREGIPGDASILIYLAQADAFEAAARCVGSILVPPSVWREAGDDGERIGAVEVPRIRAAAEAGSLRRVELSEREEALAAAIAGSGRLGSGESEVIALATRGGQAIVDEGRAARVAEARGITVVSTLFLPVIGRRAGVLQEREAIDFLRRLAVVIGPRAEVVYTIEQHLRIEEQ